MLRPGRNHSNLERRGALRSCEFRHVAIVERIYPFVAVVVEPGVEIVDVDAGIFLQPIIHSAAQTPPRALISIFAKVKAVVERSGKSTRVQPRLDIIDAPAVVVIGVTEKNSKALIGAEPLSDGSVSGSHVATPENWRVSCDRFENKSWLIAGALQLQIYRTADGVALLASGEGLVQFDRFHQIRWNYVEFHLPDGSFRRRYIDPVDSYVGKPRLRAANLHVLTFTFVAFQ